MVAIITGKGAGIENSSLSLLGSKGQIGSASLGGAQGSAYVNAATGNLVLTTNDEMLVGRGPDALISRTYNSLGAWDGDNDDQWRASPYRRVHSHVAGTSVKRTDWDGSEVTYSWNANYLGTGQGAFVATDGQGAYDTLVLSGTTWTWTDGDTGAVETYNSSQSGRIDKRQDTSGNYLKYSYTGGLLTKVSAGGNGVTEGSEYTLLVYGTGAAANQLQYLETRTTNPTATTTRVYYEYDASDRLVTVKVNLTPSDNSKTVSLNTVSSYDYVTTYTYVGASQRIASIKQWTQVDPNAVPPTDANISFTYDGSDRIETVTETIGGVASTTKFIYDTTSVANHVVTKVTDANGQTTRLLSDAAGNLVSITLPPSGTGAPAPAMSFSYDPTDGDVQTITSAGNTVTYQYDAHGNCTLERDSLGNTITREYNIAYDSANAVIKNELLQETRYTTAGNPASGALVTRYTYDSASRLRFVIDASGRVTEHRYDLQKGYGQRTSTLEYAGTYSGTPFDLPALTGWAATATAIARTDTGYDFRGNISEVVSYSKLVNGEFDTLGSERSRTFYVYNSHGDLIGKQTEGAGYGETYVYDGLGRVISTSEIRGENNLYANANIDSFWHEANCDVVPAGSNIGNLALKMTSGATNLTIASSYGAPIAVAAGDTITFTVQLLAGTYNVASFGFFGQSSQLGDPADTSGIVLSGPGTLSRIAGVFQIDGLSATEVTTVSVTRRFTLAENAYTRVYVGSANAPGAPANQSILFGNAVAMRSTSRLVYTDTAAGSTTQVTLANGLVQTSTYDLSGHLIAFAEGGAGVSTVTTNYLYDKLGRLRVVAEPALGSPGIQAAGRRRSHVFYDNDGRKIADVDADGSATEYRYDAAGRIVATIAYTTPVAASALNPNNNSGIIDANGNLRDVSFASIRPAADSVNDRWNWTFYDLAGRAIRTVDGTGAVTVLDYDGASRLVSTTELANRMSSTELDKLKAETPGTNLFTNATDQSFWSRGNVTPTPAAAIDGINAFTEAATTANLAYIQSWGQPQQVLAGEKLTFTITLKKGTVSAAIVQIRGGNPPFGSSNSEASYTISGPGTVTYQSGAYFTVTGLEDDKPTVVTITRTFTTNESATAGIYIGSNPGAVAAGDSIIVSNPIFTRAPASLPALPANDSTNDRVVRNFYDQAGRLIGTLDGEGYLTKVEYDGAGRKVRTVSYNNKPTNPADPLNNVAADSAKDISNWWVYDARGMLRGTVDGEGTLTRFDYSPAGYLTKQERGQKLTANFPFTTPPTFADLAGATGTIYEATSWTRDYAGRALTETRALTQSVTTTTSYSYDVAGNLVSMTTQSGGTDPRTYRKRYDVLGRLIAEMSGIGSATLPANPTEANLTTAYNAYGWTYAYDASDRLIAKTGPAGTTAGATGPRTLYYYNPDGALAYEVDPAGQVVEYRYNSFGQQTDVIVYAKPITNDLAGMTGGSDLTQFANRLVPDTARDSATQIMSFFTDGRVKEQKDALGNASSFTYNAFGELASSTVALDDNGAGGTARSIVTTRSYDRRGLLKVEIVDPATKAIQTSYDYDAFGRAIKLTNPNTRDSFSTFDRAGRLKSVKDALGNETKYVYDARGNLVTVEDANLNKTRFVYDKANRQIATIDAAGAVTTTNYDADGRVVETRAFANAIANPSSLQDEIDEGELVLPQQDTAKDRITRFAYDKDGRLRFTVDALGHPTELSYDVRGNVIRTTMYDGAIPSTPAGGWTESTIAAQVATGSFILSTAQHRVTRTVYDAVDQAIYTIDPAGLVAWNSYDAQGQVIKQVQYSVTYTATGNPDLAAMAAWRGSGAVLAGAADDRTALAWYDKQGRLAFSVDALGYVTRMVYDKLGNVVRQTKYATPSTTLTESTPLSDLDSSYPATPPATAQSTQFKYDTAGRLVETIAPDQVRTVLTLSQTGQMLTSTTNPGANEGQVRYEYDAVGRLEKETVEMGGTNADLETSYKYDKLGNRTRVTDPRGFVTYFYYDVLGRQTLVCDAETYGTRTTYTVFGEVEKVTRFGDRATNPGALSETTAAAYDLNHAKNATTRFEYDAMGRVKKSFAAERDANGAEYFEEYQYNNFGDRSSVRNKIGGTTTYAFDKRGMMVTETLPATVPIVNKYEYDAFGQLRFKREAFGAAEQRDTEYQYDDLGRLRKTIGETVEVHADDLTTSSFQPVEEVEYDFRGNIVLTRDAAGARTLSWYDLADRKTTELRMLETAANGTDFGVLTKWTYDANGNVETQTIYGEPFEVPATASGPAPDLPVGAANLRRTSYTYYNDNRLKQTKVAGLTTGEWTGTGFAVTLGTAGASADIVTTVEYDAAGNVIHQEDGRGNDVWSWYDKLGRKTAQIDAANYLTLWEHDAEGNVLKETRYAQTYGAAFDVRTTTRATLKSTADGYTHGDDLPQGANRITEFEYDLVGNRTVERRLSVKHMTVQSNGTADEATAASEIKYSYNGLGQVSSKTEANLDKTEYTYDAMGRLILEKGQSFKDHLWVSNDDNATPRTVYAYDGLNNLTSMRVQAGAVASDAADRVTTYAYDGAGRMTGTTDAVDNERIRLNQLTAGTLTHRYGYDKAGRQVLDRYTRQKGDGTSVTEGRVTRYDRSGRAITQTMARYNGSSWVFTSELDGNPAYDAVRTRYNVFGEVTGRGVTAGPSAPAAYQEFFDYDTGGRMWRSNTGDGVLRFHIYDKAGNQTLTIASAGADLSSYGLANYTSLLASNGGIQASGGVTTSNAVTALTVYDKRGQATETREPGRQFATGGAAPTATTGVIRRTKVYNAFGEVISETDPRGYDTSGTALANVEDFQTTFRYNTMGRLTKKTSADVSVTSTDGTTATQNPIESYGYDISGRLVSITDANTHRTTRQLLAGTGHGGSEALITREFHPDGGIVTTRYDVFGDARTLTNEVSSVQKREYDKLGRLTVQKHAERPAGAIGNQDGVTGIVQLIDYYDYDLNGQRIQHWNSQFGTSVKETTNYDAQGRVTKTVGFGGDTTTYKYSWSGTAETDGMAGIGEVNSAFGGWTKVTHAWGAPSGKDLTETQDYFGRTVYQKDYGDHVYTFTFNLAGQLLERKNNAGEDIDFTYYNSGLIAGQTGTQGIATYSYDVANNRVTETFSKAGVTWRSSVAQYDTLNRMTRWDDTGVSGGAAWVAWKYDAVGNVRNYAARYSTMGEDGVLTAPTTATTVATESYWYLYNERDRMTLSQGDLVNGAIVRGAKATAIDYYLDGNRKSALYTATLTGQRWVYVPVGGGGGPPYEDTIPEGDSGNGEWTVTTGQFVGDRREEYTYSADGFLVQTRRADADRVAVTISGEHTYTYTAPPSTANQSVADYQIDKLGRTVYYKEYGGADGSFERSGISYDNGGRVLEETAITVRRDTTTTQNLTSYKTVQTNRYVDGLLVEQEQDTSKKAYNQSEYSDGDVPDTLQKYRYVWWDGALQSEIDNDKDYDNDDKLNGGAGFDADWTTRMEYDSSGRVTLAKIRDGRHRNVHYLTDQNGMIVDRDVARVTAPNWPAPGEQENSDPAPRDVRYFFAGIQLGQVGNNGTDNLDYAASIKDRLVPVSNATGVFRNNANTATPYADFAQAYDAINAASMLSTAQSYTVNGGETLQSIAQAVWGDSSLWYLIADANGLVASDTLVAGQILTIPNKVHNIHNSADTWRPYDPNEAIGDISPSLAKPPKKPKCGMMGMILMVVVAVAVTIVTAGAAVAAMTPGLTLGQGIGAVIGTTAVGSAAAAGTAAASVGATTLVAAGAVGGAVGSIASQAFGLAIGAVDKFSWKSVALAGISGAVSAGIGQIGSGGNTVAQTAHESAHAMQVAADAATQVSRIGNVLKAVGSGFLRGAASSAITQGIGKVTGLQKNFDFLGVALAGLGGGVGAGVGRAFGNVSGTWNRAGVGLVSGMASGVANAAARSIITGSDFGDNLLAALPDIIGSTIGNLIAQGVTGIGKSKSDRIKNVSDLATDKAYQYISLRRDQVLSLANPSEGVQPFISKGESESWVLDTGFWDEQLTDATNALAEGRELAFDYESLIGNYEAYSAARAAAGLTAQAQYYQVGFGNNEPATWQSGLTGAWNNLVAAGKALFWEGRIPGRETTIGQDIASFQASLAEIIVTGEKYAADTVNKIGNNIYQYYLHKRQAIEEIPQHYNKPDFRRGLARGYVNGLSVVFPGTAVIADMAFGPVRSRAEASGLAGYEATELTLSVAVGGGSAARNIVTRGPATVFQGAAAERLAINEAAVRAWSVTNARYTVRPPVVAAKGELPTVAFSKAQTPKIADNIEAAFAEGHPSILNRLEGRDAIRAQRADALAGQARPPSGHSLDEFPFASSQQGGAGARIAQVPVIEQNIQGGILSSFYQKHGITHGDPFRVIVIP